MRIIKEITQNTITVKEKGGIKYLEFIPPEKFGSLKSGLVLSCEDGKKFNPADIPELVSVVSGIPKGKFKIVIPKQVHQTKVKIFSRKSPDVEENFYEKVITPEADALLTDHENLFLVIQVADCLPVFLADLKSQVLGLAHIGWRGALLGMAERFVKQASAYFNVVPIDLDLVLGPSIGNCCYKISDSLAVLVENKYVDKKGAERYLDLRSLVKDRFLKSGLKEDNIFVSEECTCCGDKLYQSYRRDKEKAGRMVAFIGKTGEKRK